MHTETVPTSSKTLYPRPAQIHQQASPAIGAGWIRPPSIHSGPGSPAIPPSAMEGAWPSITMSSLQPLSVPSNHSDGGSSASTPSQSASPQLLSTLSDGGGSADQASQAPTQILSVPLNPASPSLQQSNVPAVSVDGGWTSPISSTTTPVPPLVQGWGPPEPTTTTTSTTSPTTTTTPTPSTPGWTPNRPTPGWLRCPEQDTDNPVYFPHEFSCPHFYQCSHGRPFRLQCRTGLHFNPIFSVCDWPELTKCPHENKQGILPPETQQTTYKLNLNVALN